MSKVILVKAVHAYTPTNNDELLISPGDVITLTNSDEDSWWEGTLGSKTGWFPSNYVVRVDSPPPPQDPQTDNLSEYKSAIVRELLDSEVEFVRETLEFESHVLKLISSVVNDSSGVLQSLKHSYGNVINAHKNHILGQLNNKDPRVGRLLLNSDISNAHTSYCARHPTYVQFVERHQDALSGIFGDSTGVLKIISALSCPFRRIERYGNLLAELERYVPSNDRDRGDIGRALIHYRNLHKSLTLIRKQKEMELEVITPGAIRDYEGPDVQTLGEILLMDLVHVGTTTKEPRYFVLFTNTLLILSYDNVTNALIYNGRVYVSGLVVALSEDPRAFEISGPTLHSITVEFDSPSTRSIWVSRLNDLVRSTRCHSIAIAPSSLPSSGPSSSQINQVHTIPWERLVAHFKSLHDRRLIPSASIEFLDTYVREPVPQRPTPMSTAFRKHACVSRLHVENSPVTQTPTRPDLPSHTSRDFVTRSLTDLTEPTVYACPPRTSLPHDSIMRSRTFTRPALVRQNAVDLCSSNESVDSGLGDPADAHILCSEVIHDVPSKPIGTLAPQVSAWNIGNLRPNSPYNPFLEQYKANPSGSAARSSSSSTGFERASFKFKSSSFSSGIERGVSNEDDLILLSIVDSFCNANNRASSVRINRPINKHIQINNTPSIPSNRSLSSLVTSLSENVHFLNDRINTLSRQLEEEKVSKTQLIEVLNKVVEQGAAAAGR